MSKAMKDDVAIVLLHGAGLGAWIWDDVLENIAYRALAIDFPGRGIHADVPTKKLSLSKYVESVYTDLKQLRSRKIIIVAHSISGILGLELVNQLQDRLVGFIALGAVFPKADGSFISSMPRMNGIILRIMLSLAGTKPPNSAIESSLCVGLDKRHSQEVINRFIPESKKLYTDKVQKRLSIPHSLYVNLTQDRELTNKIQQQMMENLRPDQIVDLKSGHLPMLSKPSELARIVNNYAEFLCD